MKQQRQLLILAGLVVVAAGIWYFGYFRGDKSATGLGSVATVRNEQLLGIDNPELHWPELLLAQKTEYKNLTGRNPFVKEAPRPPSAPKVPASPPLPQGPQLPPPDPPPTLPSNVKFFGYGTVPNGTGRRAFFSEGEDVFIVAEGETLLGRFRIIKVNNTNLEFEEIATGRHNTAPLVEEQSSAALVPST